MSHQLSVFGSVAADHAAAGFLSGLSASLLLHPFDLIKTRLQVQHTKSLVNSQGKAIFYRNTADAVRTITSTEGYWALYKGLTPSMIGNMLSWGGYFSCYEVLKNAIQRHKTEPLNSFDNVLAGMGAGSAVLLVTNPIWVLKTRAMLDVSETGHPRSFQGITGEIRQMLTQRGVAALYKGMVPGLIGTSHGAIQIAAYEKVRTWRFRGQGKQEGQGQKLKGLDYIFCAVVSKSFASVVTYPYQVLRARLQNPNQHYDGVLDCVRTTLRREGIQGLYRGLVLNTLKVLPSCCVIFLVYEDVTFRLSEMAARGVVFRKTATTI